MSSADPPVTEWFSQTDHRSKDDKLSSSLTEYPMLSAVTARISMWISDLDPTEYSLVLHAT